MLAVRDNAWTAMHSLTILPRGGVGIQRRLVKKLNQGLSRA
jgi:hypothetical protein